MTPGIHPGFIAAILAASSSFGVGMDPTSRRKTQFPRCGSDLKSTQKRPSNRAKKYSWLREIDVLDYLATQSGSGWNVLYVLDRIKTRRQIFLCLVTFAYYSIRYEIIRLPRYNTEYHAIILHNNYYIIILLYKRASSEQ